MRSGRLLSSVCSRSRSRAKVKAIQDFYAEAVNQPPIPGAILLYTSETLHFEAIGTFDNVGNLEERLVPTLIALRRNAARNKVFTPDEQTRFDGLLQDVDAMVSGSRDLLVLLQEGRMAEAGEFYRTQTRTLFRNVLGDAYTLVTAIEDDLKKARLKIRKLE